MKAVYLLAAITISVTSFSSHASEIKRFDYDYSAPSQQCCSCDHMDAAHYVDTEF